MDFYDLYQNRRIRQLQGDVRTAQVSSEIRQKQVRNYSEDVEDRVERLALLCEGMWELLRTHSGFTDEQLSEEVARLDGSDGAMDGRRQRQASQCPCGAKVNPKSRTCQFCGAAATRKAFD